MVCMEQLGSVLVLLYQVKYLSNVGIILFCYQTQIFPEDS